MHPKTNGQSYGSHIFPLLLHIRDKGAHFCTHIKDDSLTLLQDFVQSEDKERRMQLYGMKEMPEGFFDNEEGDNPDDWDDKDVTPMPWRLLKMDRENGKGSVLGVSLSEKEKVLAQVILNKINTLTLEISEIPFSGTGKPEPLKYDLSGKWSKRINKEYRLIYKVSETTVYIFSAKGHYEE